MKNPSLKQEEIDEINKAIEGMLPQEKVSYMQEYCASADRKASAAAGSSWATTAGPRSVGTLPTSSYSYCDEANSVFPVKIKLLHPDAKVPTQGHSSDTGYDLYAVSVKEDPFTVTVSTGIAVTPPPGYHFLIHPRSSIHKLGLSLCNSIGLVDEPYTGELICKFYRVFTGPPSIKPGDRVAQLVLEKTNRVAWEVVKELPKTDRGTGGFGSTGK
jgi:dUTP pyrophosphatase